MRRSKLSRLALVTTSIFLGSAQAAQLQLSAGLESSQFLEGTNLTDDSPSVSIGADWSFDQGGFTGLYCYGSSVKKRDGLKYGCDIYAGFFLPVSDQSAVSAQVTHHDYSRGLNHKWDFTDLSASWHINKKTSVSTIYSKNWLNRPFDTFAIKAATQVTLTEALSLDLSGSVMAIESGAPVDKLTFARASLSYSQSRWTAQAGIIYTDKDQTRMVPFDVDQAELLLTINYRLY